MPTVSDLMRRNPPCAHRDDSIMRVAQAMRDAGVDVLPVCDEFDMLRGTVTLRLLVDRAMATGADPVQTTVAHVADEPPVSIEAGAPIETAFDLLLTRWFGTIPVVEGGALVGELTTAAIVGAVPDRLF